MPRRLRKDYPGAWHHVMNRGVAKRTLFEAGRDVWRFLGYLAKEARKGEIEVHAYSVLTTHFHLLLRSPRGHLSAVMQRIQDFYARDFNRGRHRDGPLFRGRFANRLVETEAYWGAVLRYIDRNPVQARLATRPVDYPYGSARSYARDSGPDWLRRDLVESFVAEDPRRGFEPRDYERFSDPELPGGTRWLVERRLDRRPPAREDPLDDLLGAAPAEVRAWLERKTRLADGTSPGWTLVSPVTVTTLLAERRERETGREVASGHRDMRFFVDALGVWTLRQHAGLTLAETAECLGLSTGTVQRRLRSCRRLFRSEESFRGEAAKLLEDALEKDFGRRRRSRVVGFAKELEGSRGMAEDSPACAERV